MILTDLYNAIKNLSAKISFHKHFKKMLILKFIICYENVDIEVYNL